MFSGSIKFADKMLWEVSVFMRILEGAGERRLVKHSSAAALSHKKASLLTVHYQMFEQQQNKLQTFTVVA